jgi:hypothetical protein
MDSQPARRLSFLPSGHVSLSAKPKPQATAPLKAM